MSETVSRLPPDRFLADFRKLREDTMNENLATPGSRSNVRGFFRQCLREHSNHWWSYRYLANEFSIEKDLRDKLDAYKPVNKHDLYKVEVHDLKLLRRIAFQRYAFSLAAEISKRLLKQGVKKGWLYKDWALLRVPLALAVGYGVVLGSFAPWLTALGINCWLAAGFSIPSLVFSWFLIYCNVRDRIGDVPEVVGRAWVVFLICLVWSALLLGGGWRLAIYDPGLRDSFHWGVAISLGSSSLLVAIVVQFFFAKSGSIADPL